MDITFSAWEKNYQKHKHFLRLNIILSSINNRLASLLFIQIKFRTLMDIVFSCKKFSLWDNNEFDKGNVILLYPDIKERWLLINQVTNV